MEPYVSNNCYQKLLRWSYKPQCLVITPQCSCLFYAEGFHSGTIWVAPYGDPLQCCMCFYRDPNYLQPILNPGGYLPLHSGGSTVLLSNKKTWLYCRILNLHDCPKRISQARSAQQKETPPPWTWFFKEGGDSSLNIG